MGVGGWGSGERDSLELPEPLFICHCYWKQQYDMLFETCAITVKGDVF